MGPAQFAPQCGANWECAIELPHIAQTLYTEAFAKLGGELFGQILQQAFAVARPVILAASLVDLLAHLPVGRDHGGVDSGGHPMLSLHDGLADGGVSLLGILDDLKLFVHGDAPSVGFSLGVL